MFRWEAGRDSFSFGCNDHSKPFFKAIFHFCTQLLFIFQKYLLSWSARKVANCVDRIPKVNNLKTAVNLCISFLQNHWRNVVSHRPYIDIRKKIIDDNFDQFSTFKHSHSEWFLRAVVLLEVRHSLAQDLSEMCQTAERSDEVAIAQLALL